MSNFFAKLVPFILFGIAIVAFAFGLVLLMYLLVFGAIVGLALYVIAWIKDKFFRSKQMTTYKHKEKQGRTIDHDDLNKS